MDLRSDLRSDFSAVRAAERDLRTLIDSSLNTVPIRALYSVISHDIETT